MKQFCFMLVVLGGLLACAGESASAAINNQQTEYVITCDDCVPANQAAIIAIAGAYCDRAIVPSIPVRRAVLQSMYDSKVPRKHLQYCRNSC